ncbi:hypothetical protein M413DRAFT_351456 [Hebeloma cylindrosporum]|uniref:Uncharacterized protein n=1 Tax=Hebeloma cylindrosporum TaxID=76867 RepID=A0A0C2Y2B6_HEBCY|nr:hypothetical protein M413DRAFT_351456 [Hebeloma cylindrosporum h7]
MRKPVLGPGRGGALSQKRDKIVFSGESSCCLSITYPSSGFGCITISVHCLAFICFGNNCNRTTRKAPTNSWLIHIYYNIHRIFPNSTSCTGTSSTHISST